MTIKDVSEKYGISQDTLRYYERVNVIPKVTRTSGGIRDYQEEDLRWVELAVCMRNAGLRLTNHCMYLQWYLELLRLYCRFDSYRRRSFLAVMKIVSLPLFLCRIAISVTNLSAKQG